MVFPEMMLTGYPVEDLALRSSFVEASVTTLHETASRLAAEDLGGIAVVTGYLDRRTGVRPRVGLPAGAPLDAAALLHGGEVAVTSAKHHLPNYGVFDEYRYLRPRQQRAGLPAAAARPGSGGRGRRDLRGPLAGRRPGRGDPRGGRRPAGRAQRVAVRAGQGRHQVRALPAPGRARPAPRSPTSTWSAARTSWSSTATRSSSTRPARCWPAARSSPRRSSSPTSELPAADPAVPGTGAAPVDAQDGTVITLQRLTLPPLPLPVVAFRGRPGDTEPGLIWPRLSELAEVYAALVTGVRDYVRKNGFASVILGLSGGIDSALIATIAADAIGSGPGPRGPDAEPRTHRIIRSTTRTIWPSGRACKPGPSRSGPWSTPTRPSSTCTGWPRRTCNPGSAA